MNKRLKEWAPLADLFNALPSKIQNGIFTTDLKLTCIDVLPDFFTLGTNFGLVYWYDRKKKTLQKLRCENGRTSTTVVKVVSTVDYMVACGNNDGSVSIFQIPKSPAESLPENLKPKNKQIERYTVSDLHKSPITALEWSKNGMKLFCGDKSGKITMTEIDFYMHICKSMEILNESYEIVQLNYYQQILLVSTTYRTIVCKKTEKWNVLQVGKKDRKILGNFGGIFFSNTPCPNDAVIYCSRPGLRIWESDLDGNVLKTLVFKDILTQNVPEIEIINPASESLKRKNSVKDISFEMILPFTDESLVIYNKDCLFVLNPKTLTIEAFLSNLRNILNVAVTKNEIFVLEGERSLIRLAYDPEPIEDISVHRAKNNSLTNSLKEITAKIQTVGIISAIPPLLETIVSIEQNGYPEQVITSAEEALESPEKENHNLTEKIHETFKKLERIDKAVKTMDKTEEETILYKHGRHKNRGVSSKNSSKDEEKTVIATPSLMEISTVGVLPDFRSPEVIKTEIQEKEKILKDILYLDTIKVVEETDKDCEEKSEDKIVVQDIGKHKKIEENKVQLESCSKDNDKNHLSNSSTFLIKKFPSSEKNEVKIDKKRTNSGHSSNGSNLPDLMNIPFDWKLNSLQIKDEETLSDTSLAEWELL